MKNIFLIACCSKKLQGSHPAEELYQSDLFKKSLAYAKQQNPDKIFILSAKHHVVELQDKLCYYNKTLNNMTAEERKLWGKTVSNQLQAKGCDFQNDKFTILAGENYRKNLVSEISDVVIPLEGMRIGEQLHTLIELLG